MTKASGRLRLLAASAAAGLCAAMAPAAQPACPEWTDPHGLVVPVSPADDLPAKVRAAVSGTTLLLEPGRYAVGAILQFARDDVTLRSRTGRREDVVLDGDPSGAGAVAGFTNEIIAVSASRVIVADVSVKHARHHAIHAYAPSGRGIVGLRLRNVHVSDCGQQLVKVNSNGANPPLWVDSGLVECSWIGFLDNSMMEPMTGGFYTGGIDIHGGRGWVIRGNVFQGIQREGKGMEHAVHLWNKARGCTVEANRFQDVYRAVGLGMKTAASGLERHYPDGKGDAPYSDYLEGVVRNNTVYNRAGIHLESGIEIMNVLDAEVCHNTVFSADPAFSSIEYRWPDTRVVLRNNLARQTLMRRDNAQAVLQGNLENAGAALFVNAANGDLHLAPGAASAIDRAVRLPAGLADRDVDGDARDSLPDIGADEYRPGAGIFPRQALERRRGGTGTRWRWRGRGIPWIGPEGAFGPSFPDGRHAPPAGR